MLIIDASVAIKWVLAEEGQAAALDILAEAMIAAPDFIVLECANVLATKVRKGVLTAEHAARSLAFISEDSKITLHPSLSYVARAQALAMELGQSAYDCLYLAVAMAEDAVVVTADGRFARATGQHANYRRFVRLL